MSYFQNSLNQIQNIINPKNNKMKTLQEVNFQNADFEFSDCYGFINGNKLELIDENYFSSGSYYFRHDNTNNRIYLTDSEGNETFKEIIN